MQTNLFGDLQYGQSFRNVSYLSSYFIQKILIRSKGWINAIQLQFSNGINSYLSEMYGGTGADLSTFDVPSGQYISEITTCWASGTSVMFLQFKTNMGVQSAKYGTDVSILGDPCPTVRLTALLGFGGYVSQGSFGSLQSIYYVYAVPPPLPTMLSSYSSPILTCLL